MHREKHLGFAALACLILACGEDDTSNTGGADAADSGGTGGSGGTAGTGGTNAGGSGGTAGAGDAGATGGSAGTAGTSGTAGIAGTGGSAASMVPTVHPQDPHRLARGGQTWYPVGYYPAIGTLTGETHAGTDYYVQLIDKLSANRINYFRNVFTMGQPYGESSIPYQRTGPGSAADGRPKVDLESFDSGHFDHWDDIVSYAQAHDVVLQISILDFWHNKAWIAEDGGDVEHEWGLKHDFYQGANNINGIDVTTSSEWVDPSHPVFEVQKALIAQTIDTLGSYPNIVWEVANEATVFQGDDGTAWQMQLADFITDYELSKGFEPHLVIPRDIPNHEMTPGHKHDAPATIHDQLVDRFEDDQPLISDDDCCTDPIAVNDRRRKAWACLTAGAHIDLFHFPMRELSVLEGQDASDGMRYVGNLTVFLTTFDVDLAGMVPSDHLVSNGWCLAREGEQTIVYLPSGGSTTVEGLPSSYAATWFDPRQGITSDAGDGPDFQAPDDKDWVLHIR